MQQMMHKLKLVSPKSRDSEANNDDANNADSELEESLSDGALNHLYELKVDELEELKEKYHAARELEAKALHELGRARQAAEALKPTHKAEQLRLRNRYLEEMTNLKSEQISQLQVAEKAAFTTRTTFMTAQKQQGELRRAIIKVERELGKIKRSFKDYEKQGEKDQKLEEKLCRQERFGRLKFDIAEAKTHLNRLRLLVHLGMRIDQDPTWASYHGYAEENEVPRETVLRLIRHFKQKILNLNQEYVRVTSAPGVFANPDRLFPPKPERFAQGEDEDEAPKPKSKKTASIKTEDLEAREKEEEAVKGETPMQALERRLASVKPQAVVPMSSIRIIKK